MIKLQITLRLEHILHIEYNECRNLQGILYKDGRYYSVYIPEVDWKYIKKYFVCRKCKVTQNLMYINPFFAEVKDCENGASTSGVTYNVVSGDCLRKNTWCEFFIKDIADIDKGDTNEQKRESLINEIKEKKKCFHEIQWNKKGTPRISSSNYKAILPKNL